MTDTLSAEFIRQMLDAQGVSVDTANAALIAANLGTQLGVASPGHDALAFELEPSAFEAAMRAGALR